MIRINLLPYRERMRRERVARQIGVAAGALLLVLMLVLSWHVHVLNTIEDTQAELARLQQRNHELTRKIGKVRRLGSLRKEVERKLAVIEQLQKQRHRVMDVLLEVAQRIPPDAWLSSMEDDGVRIRLQGLAANNKAVADFMRALAQSEQIGEVRLDGIERSTVNGVAVRRFRLELVRHGKRTAARRQGGGR